jgi:cytochrome b561
MAWRSDETGWGGVTKTFHWLISISVIALLCVGFYMHGLPNTPDKIKIYALHKSFGLTVLVLMTMRFVWRAFFDGKRPSLPPGMPSWQRVGAGISHFLLYVLVFVQTFSGWLFNSAANFPLRWFGLFSVPKLSGPDKALRELAGEVHEIVAWSLVVLVSLHVLAALKHHLVDRDLTLVRMLPWRTRREAIAGPHAFVTTPAADTYTSSTSVSGAPPTVTPRPTPTDSGDHT